MKIKTALISVSDKRNLKPLLNDNTTILSAVNGLPWWYFYKSNSGTKLENTHID